MVAVHRFVIDSLSRREAVPRRMTHEMWAGARSATWEGTQVFTPDPLDAMIMGLVLARAWSGGDRWRIKSTDYLDMSALREYGGFDRRDLFRRAAELGIRRTLDLFLKVCDPWDRNLWLGPTTRWRLEARYLAMTPERGHLSLEWLLASLERFPGTAVDAARAVPRLWTWRRRLQHDPNPGAFVLPHAATRSTPSLRGQERLVRGIKWAARLVQPTGDRCTVRSLALFEALRERGTAVDLHRGYEGAGERRRTHLWITSPEGLLRDLKSEPRCKIEARADDPAIG